jgi:hypothetical protein
MLASTWWSAVLIELLTCLTCLVLFWQLLLVLVVVCVK